MNAALLGSREGAQFALVQDVIQASRVQVTQLEGQVADTLEEDMRIAAFMAVWQALTFDSKPLQLAFENNRWQVKLA